jgi:hypothetical protein
MIRERFIRVGNFECVDVDICGWSRPDGEPVSLVLYLKGFYDEPVPIELTLEEIDRFCELLKICSASHAGSGGIGRR